MGDSDPLDDLLQLLRASDLLDPLREAEADEAAPYARFLLEASTRDDGAALVRGKKESFDHMISASDALEALPKVLLRSMYVPSMLLRSVLECSSTASWLACPNESIDEHIARSDDLRARDFKDELDFFVSAAKDPGTPAIPSTVMQLVRERRTEHARANRSARPIAYLALAGNQFDAEATYRVLSGRAHGRPWARDMLRNTWVDAFSGSTDRLEREAVGTIGLAMNWLCWAAQDYAWYVCPKLSPHVEDVMRNWGARARPTP